ncbi:chromosome partitioning protein ParA [Aureimonas jatrophae]|nr:chromosome partitioning protein ParA [Aureimonas jatrophae]MBB3949731.1 crescentin [Aureimonas jatrophae]
MLDRDICGLPCHPKDALCKTFLKIHKGRCSDAGEPPNTKLAQSGLPEEPDPMNSPLSFLFRREGRTTDKGEPARRVLPSIGDDPNREETRVRFQPQIPPLDGIGQRNEMLKVRIGEMSERLGELRTLTDDFSALINPIEAIAEELPKAQARILELEAILSQEMEGNQSLRREVDSLLGRYSAASSDLATAVARVGRLETSAREQEAAFEEQRLLLREKTTHANALERQLLAEAEHNQSLNLEVKTLRAEATVAEQALLDAERMLGEETEQRHLAEQEGRRLQSLTEDQAAEILQLTARVEEFEQLADAHLQQVRHLQAQLAVEQAARQKQAAQHENDLTALKTERSGANLKLESLTARLAATDQILGQVRHQLREREEAFRASERASKEAIAEKASFERRHDGIRNDLTRVTAQLGESQKARAELEARCDMLIKALAAKDSQLEGVTTRANNLSERVEALTQRFEKDRLALEATNRRLIEELQNEKAERTLAQGALDIARESRTALQRQNENLKRATRGRSVEGLGMDVGSEASRYEERPSNVRPFSTPDRED